jgi:hypothetical protein
MVRFGRKNQYAGNDALVVNNCNDSFEGAKLKNSY